MGTEPNAVDDVLGIEGNAVDDDDEVDAIGGTNSTERVVITADGAGGVISSSRSMTMSLQKLYV